jgi:hypothetical protein
MGSAFGVTMYDGPEEGEERAARAIEVADRMRRF